MITRYRINYHLHRKIVVIDGKISWTGGFNIGDQYLGKKRNSVIGATVRYALWVLPLCFYKNVSWWTGTLQLKKQIRSFALTPLFSRSWWNQHSSGRHRYANRLRWSRPLHAIHAQRHDATHVTGSKEIMDSNALSDTRWRRFAAWQTIAASGVDVRIMIPCKPDHPFIYRATQWYANELTRCGVKIYIYEDGFYMRKRLSSMTNFLASVRWTKTIVHTIWTLKTTLFLR